MVDGPWPTPWVGTRSFGVRARYPEARYFEYTTDFCTTPGYDHPGSSRTTDDCLGSLSTPWCDSGDGVGGGSLPFCG